jgi:hypothetical protein
MPWTEPQIAVGTVFNDPGVEAYDEVDSSLDRDSILAFGRATVETTRPTLPGRPHVIVYAAQVRFVRPLFDILC